MPSKFTNNTDKPLYNLFKDIANNMPNFEVFHAVVGYFRSSGYFKLRELLNDVPEIRILVGINIDDIFRHRNQALIAFSSEDEARKIYESDFLDDIRTARYAPEVENGIIQMLEDLSCGKLKMRVHANNNLHAKFYLCLPQNFNDTTGGWVIMGSSNISDAGLGISQPPRYELNVKMSDYDDVLYCEEQFQMLWNESIEITARDIQEWKKKTYLGQNPTPYEIYMKVLIDTFGDQVEDDFTMQLPDGVMDLKYQKDAVIQGYQMLMEHNGLFLADVVGLGKTLIATMIAKRFVEANGKDTHILVVYPPAVEKNWKDTFKLFGLTRKTQFITNGSLHKILDGQDQYKDKEEFDLIIVDEAHGFRSDVAEKYDELQKICKAARANIGLAGGSHKKVMLLSATPLNNRPEDLLNLLLLFQNSNTCTIDGIPNLKAFFAPYTAEYNRLMAERSKRDVTEEVDKIYETLRSKVLDKVTIRRTRNNIENDEAYLEDLHQQHIEFPKLKEPIEQQYQMDPKTSDLFYKTIEILAGSDSHDQLITYARYRAVEYLLPEYRERYPRAVHMGTMLAGIYRVHMVKRLESSFYAFRKSLHTLLQITEGMIQMFRENKVIIAPDMNVKGLQDKGMELDAILEHIANKGVDPHDVTFTADCFAPEFLDMLKSDKQELEKLVALWDATDDLPDPKFELFREQLNSTYMQAATNVGNKLVVFSESVDTLTYLYQKLKDDCGRQDVLMVSAGNRDKLFNTIRQNFDANIPEAEKKDDYHIILTSDVLAEGVNLHRSNVIANYDSPWNATRLMQRIGRVNRIGSKAKLIYNYMYYPSHEGDEQIALYKNALIKLQGFHSAFGEDAQIYSREEIVKQFELYDSKVKDSVDKKIALLREVRELYANNRKLYHKIKDMPLKSRVVRQVGKHIGDTLVFISSNFKTEFYRVSDTRIEAVDFLDAAEILRAKIDEQAIEFSTEPTHYTHVNRALQMYRQEYVEAHDDTVAVTPQLDTVGRTALNYLRRIAQFTEDPDLQAKCKTLSNYINEGIYQQVPRRVKNGIQGYRVRVSNGKQELTRQAVLQNEYAIQTFIDSLVSQYQTNDFAQHQAALNITDPQVIISETFI